MAPSSPVVSARYGKDNVRLFKVERDAKNPKHQTVTETTVCVLLEGEIDTSYTQGDNSVVVATDSIKNTIYIKAKEHPVTPPEFFAATLGQHFIDQYSHIHVANVNIITHRWTRISIDGKPHDHSFYRDGNDVRVVDARVTRKEGITITSGIQGLLVLKSTGSAFHGFVSDEYRTLPDTFDRILSTEVDSSWVGKFADLAAVTKSASVFDKAFNDARQITLTVFAEDNSASVQNTMYIMCQKILEAVPHAETVSFSLPNKHYFEIDLSWHKDLKNTGKDAEVYAPQSGPNGLIKVTVGRGDALPLR